MVVILTILSFQCNAIHFLQKAVSLYREKLEWSYSCEKKLEVLARIEIISMKQVKNCGGIIYKSAIALKLAPVLQQPAIYIATELAKYCQEIVSLEGKKDAVNFEVEVISSGMIFFKFTGLSIANWLSFLTSVPLKGERKKLQVSVEYKSDETTNLFLIQYSHARCCSLLLMGERDNLITLAPTTLESYGQFWFMTTADPIPWQKSHGQLQFLDYAEYELMAEIASSLDYIYCISSFKKTINWEKVANSLSNRFQAFYRQCRIWGKVRVENPKLVQARLGLVLATQSLLKFLLEEKLGAPAPLEF